MTKPSILCDVKISYQCKVVSLNDVTPTTVLSVNAVFSTQLLFAFELKHVWELFHGLSVEPINDTFINRRILNKQQTVCWKCENCLLTLCWKWDWSVQFRTSPAIFYRIFHHKVILRNSRGWRKTWRKISRYVSWKFWGLLSVVSSENES